MRGLQYDSSISDPIPYGFDQSEKIIWQVSPSQFVNFHIYFFYTLFLSAALWGGVKYNPYIFWTVPIFVGSGLYCYFETKSITYILTNQRFIKKSGVFRQIMNDVELYKVINEQFYQPFLQRICGLGSIRIVLAQYYFVVAAIPDALSHREALRYYVEKRKTEKKVWEVDSGTL